MRAKRCGELRVDRVHDLEVAQRPLDGGEVLCVVGAEFEGGAAASEAGVRVGRQAAPGE